ncbi:Uu.00g108550.m01.CDS01 [Anthostomella pinea]|uniref:Uu.00g108550.m01.CDS01 n=1 Tax=Anthostomella pinea TaxID=933095 RepID=A0AAI8YDN7_9PEZI|nr:Uu.00g108550.m01.CDS01 [Anthostomella pinea]
MHLPSALVIAISVLGVVGAPVSNEHASHSEARSLSGLISSVGARMAPEMTSVSISLRYGNCVTDAKGRRDNAIKQLEDGIKKILADARPDEEEEIETRRKEEKKIIENYLEEEEKKCKEIRDHELRGLSAPASSSSSPPESDSTSDEEPQAGGGWK